MSSARRRRRTGELHPDTANYARRVLANGGEVSFADLRAIDTILVRPSYRLGIRQQILRKNIFLGNSLAEAAVSLWFPPTENDKITLFNFTASSYTRLGGLLSNGTNSYTNTTTIPSMYLSASNGHISYYCLTNNDTSLPIIDLGSRSGGLHFNLFNGFNFRSFDSFNPDASGRLSVTSEGPRTDGHFLGSRISATDSRRYRRGIQSGVLTTLNTTLPPTVPAFLGARNVDGSVFGISNRAYCDFEIGFGLTPTQAVAWYEQIQQFQRYMGRAVEV
jgi:hypothetical protein